MKLQNRAVVFDAQTMRFEDWNGHLRVAETNLTKANVCEYWGYEIANHKQYGFQSDQKYRLLRSPDALKQAVKSFAERPIQYVHKAADADKLDNGKVIGTTGSDPSFEFPYIKDAITIWDGDYIEAIKNNTQAELSASYAFTPVIEAGEFEGQPYDAIMTDIHVDHIALVEQGRAGPDVRVADSKIIHEGKVMAKFNKIGSDVFDAVADIVGDGRANDSKANIMSNISDVIKKANHSQKAGFAKAVVGLCQGHGLIRANDEDTAGRLEETVNKAMDEDTDCKAKDSDDPVDTLEANDEDEDDKKSKADDEDEKEDKERKTDEQDEKDAKQLDKNITKLAKENEDRASDAALIEARITKNLQDTADAREHVKSLVGVYGRASDSAESVYVGALKESGTPVDKGSSLHNYQVMVDLAIKAKSNQQQSRASDSRRSSVNEKARFGATRLWSI